METKRTMMMISPFLYKSLIVDFVEYFNFFLFFLFSFVVAVAAVVGIGSYEQKILR
jgi:hypothetical protein